MGKNALRGVVIGFIVGLLLSNSFIFSIDILDINPVQMTTGDFLRILGGLVVIIVVIVIGSKIGSLFDEA